MTIQCTFPRLSKSIIDRIDNSLAEAIGLPQGAVDFLVNFDVKYRLGDAQNSEPETEK